MARIASPSAIGSRPLVQDVEDDDEREGADGEVGQDGVQAVTQPRPVEEVLQATEASEQGREPSVVEVAGTDGPTPFGRRGAGPGRASAAGSRALSSPGHGVPSLRRRRPVADGPRHPPSRTASIKASWRWTGRRRPLPTPMRSARRSTALLAAPKGRARFRVLAPGDEAARRAHQPVVVLGTGHGLEGAQGRDGPGARQHVEEALHGGEGAACLARASRGSVPGRSELGPSVGGLRLGMACPGKNPRPGGAEALQAAIGLALTTLAWRTAGDPLVVLPRERHPDDPARWRPIQACELRTGQVMLSTPELRVDLICRSVEEAYLIRPWAVRPAASGRGEAARRGPRRPRPLDPTIAGCPGGTR